MRFRAVLESVTLAGYLMPFHVLVMEKCCFLKCLKHLWKVRYLGKTFLGVYFLIIKKFISPSFILVFAEEVIFPLVQSVSFQKNKKSSKLIYI